MCRIVFQMDAETSRVGKISMAPNFVSLIKKTM